MKGLNYFLLVFLLTNLNAILSQTGPAGIGTNDGSSYLKLWLDANNGTYTDTTHKNNALDSNKVMFWKDLSGSNNDLFAQADSNSPQLIVKNPLLNNQNSIRFYQNLNATTRRNFLYSKSFSKTNDITIYCVFNALKNGAGNNVTPYQAQNYNANMWYSGAGLVDGGVAGMKNDISLALCDTSIAAGAGDSTTSTDYCVKVPVSINKTYFAVLQKEAWSGILKLAQNNGPETVYTAGAQPINNSEKYYVGSTSDVNNGKTNPFFDGHISTVLVFNKILNGAEKIILENYLSAKYNMPLLTNDLYKYDEPQLGNFDFELIGIGKANDGSSQICAKGEGIIEISNINGMNKGDFLFISHNGKPLDTIATDLPEGFQYRFERKWVCSNIGNIKNTDILVDPKALNNAKQNNLFLIVDTDNDGSFNDEVLGEGILPVAEITKNGQFLFRTKTLLDGNNFTFAKLKDIHACVSNCEDYFTPNGDGNEDVILIKPTGKIVIVDKTGVKVKSLQTPAYWDGTNESGDNLAPGIYFVLLEDNIYTTITLIK